MDLFALLPRGTSAKLAKKTGISKVTIGRALHLQQCGPETAIAIEKATAGRISTRWLMKWDPVPDRIEKIDFDSAA